jgi:hypothetical protein
MKKEFKNIIIVMLAMIVSSCNSSNQQSVEVTKIVPQTVIVTQVVRETVLVTPETTASPEFVPATNVDPADYDGIVVISQYYTYIDSGLYEQAYELLSSSAKNRHSLEEFVQAKSMWFTKVEIISILPDYVRVIEQGGQPKPEPVNEKRFQVMIIAEGEGKMSGSRLSGELQTQYVTVKLEDGEWKIDSFSNV